MKCSFNVRRRRLYCSPPDHVICLLRQSIAGQLLSQWPCPKSHGFFQRGAGPWQQQQLQQLLRYYMTKVVSCESTASRDFSVTRNNRRRFRDFVDLKKPLRIRVRSFTSRKLLRSITDGSRTAAIYSRASDMFSVHVVFARHNNAAYRNSCRMATKDHDERGADVPPRAQPENAKRNLIRSGTTNSDSIDELGHCRQTPDAVGSFK